LTFTTISKIYLFIKRLFSFFIFLDLLNAHIFLWKYIVHFMILLFNILKGNRLFIQKILWRVLIRIDIDKLIIMIDIIKMYIWAFSLNNLFIILFNINIFYFINCFVSIWLVLWVIQNRLFKWRVIINMLMLLLLGFKFEINATKLLF
jgi:hypothetical protein